MIPSNGIKFIIDYLSKKTKELTSSNDALDTLSKKAPGQIAADFLNNSTSDNVWNQIKAGPLAQLGKDYVSEMITKNGNKIINNVETIVSNKISKQVQQLEAMQNMVFDSVTALLTAKNDLSMFFIQQLAKQILTLLDKKKAVTLELRTKVQELYNILILITTTSPFFDSYLSSLRQALIKIYVARNDLSVVRNTLEKNNTWLKVKYNNAIEELRAAEKLIEPDPTSSPSERFDGNVLSGVGVPKKPQQVMLLLSLAQKVKEVMLCANGYFILVAKVNALLLAYITAYGQFTGGVNRKLKQFTLSTMDNLISMLDELISSMATNLNGSPSSILTPDTVNLTTVNTAMIKLQANQIAATGTTTVSAADIVGSDQRPYKPDPVRVSAEALGWVLDLKSIITYSQLVPGPTLEGLNVSNTALSLYEDSVEKLKKLDSVSDGNAVLTATDAREEIGQLERQLITFTLAAAQGVYNTDRAKEVIPLGRTLIKRLDLTLSRDTEIYSIISRFANADLAFPTALKKTGDNVYKMLDKFGLDRASDLLRSGGFSDFFNLNSKTATYAGAAIAGFSVLAECLGSAEAKEQINQAKREIERDQKSKELINLRSASSGFQTQMEENNARVIFYEKVQTQTLAATDACKIPTDFIPSNLLKNWGSVVGVSLSGNKSVQDKITKIGKGVF